MSVDPLAHQYYSHSPYNYVLNNPLIYIDPKGLDVYIYGSDSTKIVTIFNGEDKHQHVYSGIDYKTDDPIEVDITKLLESYENLDAWGASINVSVTWGGGGNGGFDFVHFLKGENAGQMHMFGTSGVNVGLEASAGGSGFVAWNQFSTKVSSDGWIGRVNGYSIGLGNFSGGYFWSNTHDTNQIYPGQHEHRGIQTTWQGVFVAPGASNPSVGAKWYQETVKHIKRVY